jgi:hypothetical protein
MSIMKRALVLSLAVVLGFTFASFAQGELHGEWDTTIYIDPTATDIATFFDFKTEIEVEYSVGGWTFGSYTKITDDGWVRQYFSAAGSFGAFSIDSMLEFLPAGAFVGWYVDTSFIFGSVDLGFLFVLLPNDVMLDITAAATTGLVDIDFELVLGEDLYDYFADCLGLWPYAGGDGACDFDFAAIYIDVDFPFCCADVHMDLDFTCEGFTKACFEVKGVAVPNLPWLTLEVEICFQTLSKGIDVHPTFNFGDDVCFDLYFEVLDEGDNPLPLPSFYHDLSEIGIGGFKLVGVGLECEIGGVSFSGLSYWGSGMFDYCLWGLYLPSILDPDGTEPIEGLEGAWEAYRIATTEDGCCGPFDFDLTFIFDGGAPGLFDVSRIIANFSYELGPNFVFELGFDYTVGVPGLQSLEIGFEITW